MAQSLRKQTLTLTLANAYTRVLGFGLRLLTARLMGAQALGVMELAAPVTMLAITPVTAGIPAAISAMTALPGADEPGVLRAGLTLVRRLSAVMIPALVILSPGLSWLLGDWRTLPAILASAPSVLLLGLCAVYSGWFCGRADMRTPALNECAEQTVRCCLCAALLLTLKGRGVAVVAALPGVAEIAAGLAVWMLFRRSTPRLPRTKADPALTRQVLTLAAPTTAARLCQTALRTLNAILMPVCLTRSGLTQDAATAQFGMLSGMATPLLMLPGVVTGAICTVAAPAVSRQIRHHARLRRTMRQLLLGGAGVGALASALIFSGADFISTRLFAEPALAPLLRLMAPCALLMAVQQVQYGMITGMSLQVQTVKPTLCAALLSLLLTALLCPHPAIRLSGAAVGSLASGVLRVVWNHLILRRALRSPATSRPCTG